MEASRVTPYDAAYIAREEAGAIRHGDAARSLDMAGEMTTFAASGGPLVADTWTAALRSTSDAAIDAAIGELVGELKTGNSLDAGSEGEGGGDLSVLFQAEGEALPTSWTNPQEPLDVNADSAVTPIDVLVIINTLNSLGPRQLDTPSASATPPPYLDTSGDGYVSAIDALLAINFLNTDDDGSNSSDTTYIKLQGDSIAVDGNGATATGGIVTVTAAGTYSISGTLNDGQVIVDTTDDATVTLSLNGANITCSDSAPIYVANADETVIALVEGTQNHITDGTSYPHATTEDPNAAVFSWADLTIRGNGSLTVDAKFNDGITSKDDLTITGGTLTVNAVNDGIRGRDSITIQGGTVTVKAGGDGLQSNNDGDLAKGVVAIESGTVKITAGADGIQAQTQVLIDSGSISISSGGGSTGSSSSADSAKGIKAVTDVTIAGGVIDVNSRDDAVHSDANLTVSGGTLTLASADDGIHADSTVTINGGTITITKCYEGIESAVITINDGNIHVVSSDDGINIAGGVDGSGWPGGPPFGSTGDDHLDIHGGTIVVNSVGDGVDVNGSMTMTGGTLIVHGPTANNNGAVDYDGTFLMSGGLLVAVGSSGMAQAPSTSSTQASLSGKYGSTQAAGTMLHIEAADGTQILTFVPAKAYQSIVVCSPLLKKGTTYSVYSGGSSTGAVTDGLHSGGTYTAGTKLGSITLS